MYLNRLTAFPNNSSACRVYLPNLSRIRHSSVLNSRTSPSSSVCECHTRLCWISTRMLALIVLGLRPENLTSCGSGRRPLTSRTDATFYRSRSFITSNIGLVIALTAVKGPKCEWIICTQRLVVWDPDIRATTASGTKLFNLIRVNNRISQRSIR
jgi:hypothetical protein